MVDQDQLVDQDQMVDQDRLLVRRRVGGAGLGLRFRWMILSVSNDSPSEISLLAEALDPDLVLGAIDQRKFSGR